jgi:ABC-type phosphate/phosphonate transport system substrate-binding protein
MYDWAEVEWAHDALWARIRNGLRLRGFAAPEDLTRTMGLWELWSSPNLVLGQTCALPYRQQLFDRVALIGTADYGLPDTPAGHYHSVFVTRKAESEDLKDYVMRVFAFNGHDSQSGWSAAQTHAAGLGFRFAKTLHSGAHRASAAAVVQGEADLAAIDAVTWRLIEIWRPETARALKVIARTEPTPGLPLICAPSMPIEAVRAALSDALTGLASKARAALGIGENLILIESEAYRAVPTPGLLTQDVPAT